MADCSKTEVFLAELERMCYSCDAVCSGCGFEESGDCGQISVLCECGQAVVQKWSDEHPAPKKKTYADDFFEKFPNAPKDENGLPKAYLCDVYASKSFECFGCAAEDGRKCWLEPYPEQEESK